MKKIIVLLFLIFGLIEASTIRIAVAANMSYAIRPLIKAFNQKYPNTKVQVILGSSGKLTAQITHGAPYDIFLSANILYPSTLYRDGVATTKPIVYAKGALVLLSRKPRDYCAELYVLKSPDIQKIAVGNPKTAPYGKASLEALRDAKLYRYVKKKLVYGESISQTVTYTLKATDIGIIAKSALFSSNMSHFKEGIHWAEVEQSLYAPIDQAMVILKHAQNRDEVRAFYDFILSPNGQKVLQDFGYLH